MRLYTTTLLQCPEQRKGSVTSTLMFHHHGENVSVLKVQGLKPGEKQCLMEWLMECL